jgi:hypothetical protein
LYEMTTGALPFRGESTGLILDGIMNRAPVAPVRSGHRGSVHRLTLWKDADPDIPILKEAKAEYAKLQ